MKKEFKVLVGAAALVMIGCVSAPPTYQVTYYSQPAGAAIAQDGKVYGRAPVTLIYSTYNRDLFFQNSRGVTCTWASGAKVATPELRVNLYSGASFQTSCARPENHPDLEKDLALADSINNLNQAKANQDAQTELLKRQTEATEGILGVQYLNSLK